MDNATLTGTDLGLGLASIKMAAGLLLILGLIFLGLALLRRHGFAGRVQSGGRVALRVEDRIVLGPRKQVVMVRFLNKLLLLGVTDSGITLITEADHDPHSEHATFSEALERENHREVADTPD
ncbi:MAG: flagellar biosynthetic protein FliO [Deltaproteobacteria bacterium]|nr:flagellar biosynthetic protein FliO [Deltaproteobacteria bacterium]